MKNIRFVSLLLLVGIVAACTAPKQATPAPTPDLLGAGTRKEEARQRVFPYQYTTNLPQAGA